MSGEKSVKSGNDGQKIVVELLKLIGWQSVSEQIQYECSSGDKHKTKESIGIRKNHDIDCLFQYDNPLNHNNQDINLISIKHNSDKYSNKALITSHIKDLAQSLECSEFSQTLDEKYMKQTNKEILFNGVLFWLSSDAGESDKDFIKEITSKMYLDEKQIAKETNFKCIFIVDNKKATFLISAIKTAQLYRSDAKLKFLYAHTGSNSHPVDLLLSGTILPVQLINSTVLPIILDNVHKISFLLFCNLDFEKDSLRRLIWLAHKLVGHINEIVIYFRNYDITQHENIANATKQEFKDTDFIQKIVVRKFTRFDFITLKESQNPQYNSQQSHRDTIKIHSNQMNDNELNQILPFGEMLKPILSSSMLSDTDLKNFLISKGIYIKSQEKKSTIPIFTNLLLSPDELNHLRNLLITKEDKPKFVSRYNTWTNPNKSVFEVLKHLNIKIPQIDNIKILGKLQFKRLSDNEVSLDYELERTNSTKDLLTGVTRHTGQLIVKLDNKQMFIRMEHTAQETYRININIFEQIEKYLKLEDCIAQNFQNRKFSDFDNKTRIDFLLSFRHISSKVFTYRDIENVKFKPDSSIENLPSDLESLKGKANELNINGQRLDKTLYFTDDSYKACILLERVKIKFDFKSETLEEGTCLIELGYPYTLTRDDSDIEFQTSIAIDKGKKMAYQNLNPTVRLLTKQLDEIVNKQYEAYKNKMI